MSLHLLVMHIIESACIYASLSKVALFFMYCVSRKSIVVCHVTNEVCYCVLQLRVLPGARTWVLRRHIHVSVRNGV